MPFKVFWIVLDLRHQCFQLWQRSATGGRRDQSARCRAGSPSGFRQTRYGGDPVVQFPCTSHPPYTPSIVDRSGTDTGLQSDPDETGLLQLGTLRRASQQHPEVAAGAEQYSQNRPLGTEAVSCQTADASTTLAAGSTQNCLQGRLCVDIQDSEHVCTAVPQPTHQSPRQRTDTRLVGYATAHPTVRSHRLRETFFSMCRAVCLELTSRVCHRKRLIVCIQI